MKPRIVKLVLAVAIGVVMLSATGCEGGNVYVGVGVAGPYGYGPYGPYRYGGVHVGMPIYP